MSSRSRSRRKRSSINHKHSDSEISDSSDIDRESEKKKRIRSGKSKKKKSKRKKSVSVSSESSSDSSASNQGGQNPNGTISAQNGNLTNQRSEIAPPSTMSITSKEGFALVLNQHILDEDGKIPTYEDEHGKMHEKEMPNFSATGILALEDQFEREAAMRLSYDAKKNAKSGGNGNPHKPNLGDNTNFRFQDIEQLLKNKKKLVLPPDARIPESNLHGKWRIYVFTKDNSEPKIAHLKGKAEWIFGKDRTVVDIPTDHMTCSKQHAIVHFRQKGTNPNSVVPYIMDLDSTNGTFLNDEKMEATRYYEILHQDKVKFANSTREYIFMKLDPPET